MTASSRLPVVPVLHSVTPNGQAQCPSGRWKSILHFMTNLLKGQVCQAGRGNFWASDGAAASTSRGQEPSRRPCPAAGPHNPHRVLPSGGVRTETVHVQDAVNIQGPGPLPRAPHPCRAPSPRGNQGCCSQHHKLGGFEQRKFSSHSSSRGL